LVNVITFGLLFYENNCIYDEMAKMKRKIWENNEKNTLPIYVWLDGLIKYICKQIKNFEPFLAKKINSTYMKDNLYASIYGTEPTTKTLFEN